MKQKQVLVYEESKKEEHEFLDILLKNCEIDLVTGQFFCKRCKNLVHVDWQRKLAFCDIHIISRFGVTYIDEMYNIHV